MKDVRRIKRHFKVKLLLLFGILFIFYSFPSKAQSLNEQSILKIIDCLEGHPFSDSCETINDSLMNYLEAKFGEGWGDRRYIVLLKMNIHPSLICLFIRRYLIGKAGWIYINETNVPNDSAKLAGIISVNNLYRKIKNLNPLFYVPMLEEQIHLEESGTLLNFVQDALSDCSKEPFGEYAAPLRSVIQGYNTHVDYGLSPTRPIETGVIPGYVQELEYLQNIRGPNGQRLSYKLIHAGCESDMYDKITSSAALLDEYEVKIKGLEEPIILYFDAYHKDTLYCPKGFTYID